MSEDDQSGQEEAAGSTVKSPLDWRKSKPHVGEGMSHLLDTGLFTDVTFKVGTSGFTFNAHKLILMMRSEVFAVQFNPIWSSTPRDSNDERTIVHIPDKSPESFKHFLKYLYMDEFPAVDVLDVEDALELLDLAHLYLVPGLLSACSDLLKSKIGVSSCQEIFEGTRLYSEVDLSEFAYEFMCNNLPRIVSNNQFCELGVPELRKLLESENLSMDELQLFKSLLRWGSTEGFVKDENGEEKLRKDVMMSLMPSIRFLLISPEDFAREVIPAKVLSEAEVLQVFCYHHNHNGGEGESEQWKKWSRPRHFRVMENDEVKCFKEENDGPSFNAWSIIPQHYSHSASPRLIPQFRFQCSSPILIRGLKFYGVCKANRWSKAGERREFEYHVNFSISASTPHFSFCGEELFNSSHLIKTTELGHFDVLLERPFRTVANHIYWISASLKIQGGKTDKKCEEGLDDLYTLTQGKTTQANDVSSEVKSKSRGLSFKISHNESCTPLDKESRGGKAGWKLKSRKGSDTPTRTGIVHSILFNRVSTPAQKKLLQKKKLINPVLKKPKRK